MPWRAPCGSCRRYFPRQRAAIDEFVASTGVDVRSDFLPVDPFWHDARAGLAVRQRGICWFQTR